MGRAHAYFGKAELAEAVAAYEVRQAFGDVLDPEETEHRGLPVVLLDSVSWDRLRIFYAEHGDPDPPRQYQPINAAQRYWNAQPNGMVYGTWRRQCARAAEALRDERNGQGFLFG